MQRSAEKVGISSPAVFRKNKKKWKILEIIEGYKNSLFSSYKVGYQLKAIITIRAFYGKIKNLFLIKVKNISRGTKLLSKLLVMRILY